MTDRQNTVQNKNRAQNRFGIISAVAVAFILSALFLWLYLLSLQFDKPLSRDAEYLYDWKYISGNYITDLSEERSDWSQIASPDDIDNTTDAEYIRLITGIPPSDAVRYVYIITYYNQVDATLNEQKAVDAIKLTGKSSGRMLESAKVEPSDTTTTLDIIMRRGIIPSISVFISENPQSFIPLTVVGAFGGFLYALTFALGVLALAVGYRQKIRNIKNKLFLIAFSSLFLDSALIFTSLVSYYSIGGAFLLKIGFSLIMAAGSALIYILMQSAGCYNSSGRNLCAINVVYAAIFITGYKDTHTLFWISLYGAFFSIELIYVLFMAVYKNAVGTGRKKIALTVIPCIIYAAFWLMFLYDKWYNISYMLAFSLLPVLVYAIYFSVNESRLAVKKSANQDSNDDSLMIFKPKDIGEIGSLLDIFLENPLNLKHVRNISLYVYEICIQSGMDPKRAEFVAKASFLHDIGKIMVPANTVTKEGVLTNEEYEAIKLHAQYGYDILSAGNSEFLNTAAVIAKQHHERFDGNGYFRMKADQIHIYAQITCIADVFDAVTADRQYKKAWSFDEGFNYIANHGGTYFSYKYVEAFVKCRDRIYQIYRDTRD